MAFYALVYYPTIEGPEFHALRRRYEPYAQLLPEHLPLVFPVPDSIGQDILAQHIERQLKQWKPFRIRFAGLHISWDHWLSLSLQEGREQVIRLHDQLYTGPLRAFLRKDLPYTPHLALGYFGKASYDPDHPTQLPERDEDKLATARKEFESLSLDLRRTLDRLTLVELQQDYSACQEIRAFPL